MLLILFLGILLDGSHDDLSPQRFPLLHDGLLEQELESVEISGRRFVSPKCRDCYLVPGEKRIAISEIIFMTNGIRFIGKKILR